MAFDTTLHYLVSAAHSIKRRAYSDVDTSYSTMCKLKTKPGYYPYIACHEYGFVKLMLAAKALQNTIDWSMRRKLTHGFIDVGCGIGDKCLLAHEVFDIYDAHGIEYVSETAQIAREKLSHIPGIVIHQGDAFDFNFKQYAIIYMYRPIADDKLYERLYRHVVKRASPGAIIIEALPHDAANKQWTSLFESGPQKYFSCDTGNQPYSNGLCVKTENGLRRYNHWNVHVTRPATHRCI